MKLTKYSQLRDDAKVTCYIKGEYFDNAKLIIDASGNVYIEYVITDTPDIYYSRNVLLCTKDEDCNDWNSDVSSLSTIKN